MLTRQIKLNLNVWFASSPYIMNGTKKFEHMFFQYSKTIIWFSKGVLLMSAANKWSSNSDKELAYFTSILLTKVSEIINQYPRYNFTPSSTTTRGRLQIWAPQKLVKEFCEDKLTIWNSQ